MNSITHKRLKDTLLFGIGILLIGTIIEIICVKINNQSLFPHFITTIKNFFMLLGKKETYIYSGYTILHLLISIAFAAFFGISLGVLSGMRKEVYTILKPLFAILRSMPIVVLILVLMIALNLNDCPVIATSLILTPLIYEGVYQGVSHLDKDLLDVYKMNSNFNLMVLFRVYLPLIASYSKTVFINALGMGIKVLITTEYLCGVRNTLGQAVHFAWNESLYADLYAYSILTVVLTLVLEAIPYGILYFIRYIQKIKSKKR